MAPVITMTASRSGQIWRRSGRILKPSAHSCLTCSSMAGGIKAGRASFTASASRGDDALGGLTAGMGTASLLMAAGCAWGLTRRLAEYR